MANKVPEERIIASVDVGTTKICVLVAQVSQDNHVDIIGIGQAPSDGLRKGVVVDVARAISSIKSAVKEAGEMAGIPIKNAVVGISGAHVHSINSRGVVPLTRGRVRKRDVSDVIAAARAVPIKDGEQILHALPQYFTVDGDQQLDDPVGMHGVRLETEAHIVIGGVTSVQNLIECCQAAGLYIDDIVLEQIASSHAVLSSDERKLGAAILDIGGGTSDLALYRNGSIMHTAVLPVAGSHFTNDLAIGLRIALQEAERIKKDHGVALSSLLAKDEHIEVKTVNGHQKKIVLSSELVHILQPRAEELLEWVNQEILSKESHISIASGLIITGGGSLLRGLDTLAEKICNMPARVGKIRLDEKVNTLSSPIYATGYGLLMYTIHHAKKRMEKRFSDPLAKRVVSRMKSWISGLYNR